MPLLMRLHPALFLTLLALLLPGTGHAVDRDWPDVAAPCNSTLQACIDGAGNGDTIRITALAPDITGTIVIAKSLTLTSGPSARGLLRNATVQLIATQAGNQNIRVSKLVLENSSVFVSIGSNEPLDQQTVVLSELRIRHTGSATPISISPLAFGSQRQITVRDSEFESQNMVTVAGGLRDDGLTIQLFRNIFRSGRAQAFPINWTGMDAGSRFDVVGNRFESLPGNGTTFLYVSTQNSAPSATGAQTNIDRNVWIGTQTGLRIDGFEIPLQVRIRNNSFSEMGAATLFVPTGPAALDVGIANNLFTRSTTAMTFAPLLVAPNILTRSRNLYHDLAQTPVIGFEANAVLAPPMTLGRYNLRLNPGSPAVDAGDNSQAPALGTDHDGIVGSRGTAVDIGAFEFDDGESYLFGAGIDNIAGNTVPMSIDLLSPALNDLGIAQRIVMGDGAWLPTDINFNLGIYSTNTHYELFTQNLATFPQSELRILRPGVGTRARDLSFVHRAIDEVGNPGNNVTFGITRIPTAQFPSSLGPASSLTPIIFQRWDPPGSTGTYNNHPVGIYFNSGSWRIYNEDQANMPHNAGFHVIVPSAFADYAFKVNTRVTRFGIELDHPRLNDNPCAHVYLTSAYGDPLDPSIGEAYVPSTVLAQYNRTSNGGGSWVALRGDGASFAAGTVLHVYVDPESSRSCREERPFSDGFE